MKANEFVKLRGINYCKELLILAVGCAGIQAREDNSRVSIGDLERLVESHELVEWHGGLKYAKSYFERNSVQYPNVKGWDKLAEAIADVESCL